MNRKLANAAGALIGLTLFLAALWVLHRALATYHYRDLILAARSVPASRLTAALLLTALNYLVLTGYDVLAFRYIGRSLPYAKVAFASFIGYSFSNNIGLSLLSGSSVRYRLYTAWGLSVIEVTRMVIFYTLTLWLGLLTVAGISFVAEPVALPLPLHLPFVSARPLGFLFLLAVAGYLVWSRTRKRPVRIIGHEIALPAAGLSLAQLAVSSLDWALAGSVLYVLLPSPAGLSLPAFFAVYLLALVAGLVSQVPGGLGVFETVILLLLPRTIPAASVAGALLVYRGIYYLLPLGAAAGLLGGYELFRARRRLTEFARSVNLWVSAIAPRVLSFLIFAGGAMLLFTGATPAFPARLEWVRDILPLPVLELSHFLASIVGTSLLLLAVGIQRRLDAAYHLTVLFLGAGILMALARGADYEEALVLAVMLAALLPSRRFFYRRTSLLGERFTAEWIAAIIAVIAGSIWLGFFSYRHMQYSGDLWWRFTLHGDAPRFLRATVGAVGLAMLFAIARLLRPPAPEPHPPGSGDLARARMVIAGSTDAKAALALLGDKRLLFSESGRSFIMYGVEGRSWIAMGDPVGPAEERKELVWRFRDLCDRHGGLPVFYEVGTENLYLYLDLGLTPLKIGEEARVFLPDFTLEGGVRKRLRYLHSRVLREGAVLSIVPAEEVPPLLPRLREISDSWLAEKNTREKRFSLGNFNESYLREFPLALVEQAGEIRAFANLWASAGREELSIDLMRQVPGSLGGIMDYLFVELMLWGKAEGYRWFNLGMVPFAGLEDRALSPLWNRLGARIFRHGEYFYNFQGLRQFKEHFDPRWEPKYLVSPGGFVLPAVLANLAALISGGLRGVVGR